MRILGVIPARAGSKGIKNKNIIKLNNKSLIEYTFLAANKSLLKNIFLISDCLKTKKIAKKYKINYDYIRPKKLSKDNTSLIQTFNHFNKWLKKNNYNYDYVMVLQPTSPLRSFKDINNCIKLLKVKKPLSLFSVSNSIEHPSETISIKKKQWDYIINRSKKIFRRQDFGLKSFFENGAIYATHKSIIEKRKLYTKKNHICYLMPKTKSFDINDKEDLVICEKMLKN